MKLGDASRFVREILKERLKPTPKESIAEFGRRNVKLSAAESADFPGSYDVSLNPVPGVLFDMVRERKYKRFAVKKSSQSGLTLVIFVILCWWFTYVRRNVLYVMDTEREAKKLNQKRATPIFKTCKSLKDRVTRYVKSWSSLSMSFGDCGINFVGSASASGLNNYSAGLVVYDEVATHKKRPGKASARDLGKERGKRQMNFLEILISKPLEWEDGINQEYLHGSRHRCFVPCPHCGHKQVLDRPRLRYQHLRDKAGWLFDRFNDEVHCECENPKCGKQIKEEHKAEMIRRIEYRATNDGSDPYKPDPDTFSLEITDMLSLFPSASWATIAKELAEAEGDPVKFANVVANRFAEPRRRERVATASDDIWKLCGRYNKGECPVAPDIVLMFVDVQKIKKKWVKCGFRLRDNACWIIDYGEELAWEAVRAEADEPIRVLDWEGVPEEERIDPVVWKGLVDEGDGNKQSEVRDFCISTFMGVDAVGRPTYRFLSSHGEDNVTGKRAKNLVTPPYNSAPNVTHNTTGGAFPIWVYYFSDDHFKDELYNQRIAGGLNRQKDKEATGPYLPIFFPADIDDVFVGELCQERLEWSEKLRRYAWIRPKGLNDFGDGVKGCLVSWYLVRPQVALYKAGMN
ncbi:MAG: terminase gpA endonuclease subunit [Verrucomicrobiales bacterium]